MGEALRAAGRFERHVVAGQGLTDAEPLGLIAGVRRLRAEQGALAEVLVPARLGIGLHPVGSRPNQ